MLLASALTLSPGADAKGGHSTHYDSHGRAHKVEGVARDAKGHIARSPKARGDFQRSHPCPSTGRSSGACPGYVIDHVQPLKRGGADSPGNMQWQRVAQARAKDRTE
jgi:hypothetical protein